MTEEEEIKLMIKKVNRYRYLKKHPNAKEHKLRDNVEKEKIISIRNRENYLKKYPEAKRRERIDLNHYRYLINKYII